LIDLTNLRGDRRLSTHHTVRGHFIG